MSKSTSPKKMATKVKKPTEEKIPTTLNEMDVEITEPVTDNFDSSDMDPALEELFLSSIKDIYWAENHLVKSLPKMIKAATAEALKIAISDHLEETKEHVARLESIFELLGKQPQAKKCDAMEGITMEGEEIIEETEIGTATRDVGIILASQKVEHYEIATYGGLAQLAATLNKEDIAEILYKTLEEEKLADKKLTEIAENDINYQASVE